MSLAKRQLEQQTYGEEQSAAPLAKAPLGQLERVLIDGDLSALSAPQRAEYYMRVCDSVALNPLTKPFEYIKLNGKLVLYATRACTDQLRARDNVSITLTERRIEEGVCMVTAEARMPNGRKDMATGAVVIENLRGEARANAIMKAETKAKRRVTLSVCGLGMLDETEVSSVTGAERVEVDTSTGEIRETAPPRLNGGPIDLDAWRGRIQDAQSIEALREVHAAAKAAGVLRPLAGQIAERKADILEATTKTEEPSQSEHRDEAWEEGRL